MLAILHMENPAASGLTRCGGGPSGPPALRRPDGLKSTFPASGLKKRPPIIPLWSFLFCPRYDDPREIRRDCGGLSRHEKDRPQLRERPMFSGGLRPSRLGPPNPARHRRRRCRRPRRPVRPRWRPAPS